MSLNSAETLEAFCKGFENAETASVENAAAVRRPRRVDEKLELLDLIVILKTLRLSCGSFLVQGWWPR
jgi:hypothetical protein